MPLYLPQAHQLHRLIAKASAGLRVDPRFLGEDRGFATRLEAMAGAANVLFPHITPTRVDARWWVQRSDGRASALGTSFVHVVCRVGNIGVSEVSMEPLYRLRRRLICGVAQHKPEKKPVPGPLKAMITETIWTGNQNDPFVALALWHLEEAVRDWQAGYLQHTTVEAIGMGRRGRL